MFWRLGWFLQTLNYFAEKDIRETVFQNENFKLNRWNIFYKLMIGASRNALVISLLTPIVIFIISYSVFLFYDELKSFLIFDHGLRNLDNLNKFRFVIIGTQATILGLIFPLVIGFIGFLIQSRSSHEAMWHIYKNTSAFLLVGSSGLLLILYLVVIELVSSWENYSANVSYSFGILVWFAFNVMITTWFLWITVKFISPKSRMEIILKYALNDVITNDIKHRLKSGISKAYGSDYLKKASVPKSKDFVIKPYWLGKEKSGVDKLLKSPEYLTNVYYRLLWLGLWAWGLQAKFSEKTSDQKPVLAITAHFQNFKSKKHSLAKSNLTFVNLLSEFLIQTSCRFSKKRPENEMDTVEIVRLLLNQLEDALKDKNITQFEKSIKDLESLLVELELSLNFVNDNRKNDNWLQLADGSFLFGRSILDIFAREMFLLSEKASKNLLKEPSYFNLLTYFYPHLFSNEPEKRSLDVGIEYIHGHYYLWQNLLSNTVSNDKNIAEKQVFDSSLKGFIGSWEHWHYFFEGRKLIEYPNNFELALNHLKNTACMVIQALKYENSDAAEWASDTLIYWYELFSDRNEGYQHYGWLHEIISPELITSKLEKDLEEIVFNGKRDEENKMEETIIALRNTWEEVRLIVCAYIIQSMDFEKNQTAKTIVNSLLNAKRLKSTTDIEMPVPKINSGSDMIKIYLRMQNTLTSRSGFDSWQERFIERLSSIERPAWVPGRSYSSVGTEYGKYLPFFFRVFTIGLTNSNFHLSKEWVELFKTDINLANRIKSELNDLKSNLHNEDILKAVSLFFDLNASEAERNANLLVESIDLVLEKIGEGIEEIVTSAKISDAKLKVLGLAATGESFNKVTAPFPINLFEFNVDSDQGIKPLSRLTVQDYQRSHLSDLDDYSVAINESEWLAKVVQSNLITSVYRQLIHKVKWQEEINNSFIELLHAVASRGQELIRKGKRPIFFIGPWKLYELIDSAIWKIDTSKELPFHIEKRESLDDSYLCHLDDIEIHRLPFRDVKFSLLVSKEVFGTISTVNFEDSRFVNISFDELGSEDKTKGTLIIEYLWECVFNKEQGYKYAIIEE